VDQQPVLERVVAGVKPLADRQQLALRLVAAPALPTIVSDARRLEQIVINLVNNAVKFTERGAVTLEAATGDGGWVHLRVSDTGEGIRPEDLPRLFQPFTQVDTGLTRKHEGTGLGLAICKRLATLLGGDIRCTSVFGEGSTFTVLLPAQPRPS
jgi:signal transduction histidine kinase